MIGQRTTHALFDILEAPKHFRTTHARAREKNSRPVTGQPWASMKNRDARQLLFIGKSVASRTRFNSNLFMARHALAKAKTPTASFLNVIAPMHTEVDSVDFPSY